MVKLYFTISIIHNFSWHNL